MIRRFSLLAVAVFALAISMTLPIHAQTRLLESQMLQRLQRHGIEVANLGKSDVNTLSQKQQQSRIHQLMFRRSLTASSSARPSLAVNQLTKQTAVSRVLGEGMDKLMYGYVPYASNWTVDEYGLYSFRMMSPTAFNKMPDGPDGPLAADGGGCYYDGKYYAVQYMSFFGMVVADFCVYNTDTWQLETYLPVGAGSVGTDMDYDPVTGYLYGCFYSDDWSTTVFGYINPSTGERTMITPLDRIYFAMSVNSKGEVYGICEDGALYKFDKQTGAVTKIGDTGYLPEYLQSMTFDQKTDRLYWSLLNQDMSQTGLYEVDVNTGKAALITHYPYNQEVQGMFVPVPAAEDDAPARVENIVASFDKSSLQGTLNFTMPTLTYASLPLDASASLGYEILVNDVHYVDGTAITGAEVIVPMTMESYGDYKFSVRASNAVGASPLAYVNTWVGNDVPKAVLGLKAEEGSSPFTVNVSWQAPNESQHGGYLDFDNMEYRVQRCTHDGDSVEIALTKACAYTDTIVHNGTMCAYYYVVTPVVEGNRYGEPATSNALGIGEALPLPYVQNFDDATSFDLLTIIDRHEDGKTWAYDPAYEAARADYEYVKGNQKNDWLITPALRFSASHVYKLSYETWAREGNDERLEVKMGQGKTQSDMTVSIMPRTIIPGGTYREPFFHILAPAEDGDYNIGFRACSDADKWWLYLDNIKVEEGPLVGTPNRVHNLTVRPADMGELKATLTFRTPSTTVDGKVLENITQILVYRNNALVATIDAPALGEQMTYTDEAAKQGNNHYRVVPVNAVGEGLEAEADVYVGVDVPKAPKNVVLSKVDGKAHLTWDAPTEGVNGAYVDPEKVAYYVVRSDNEQVASLLYATEFTDPLSHLTEGQQFYSYAIFAQNAAGLSQDEYAISNEMCFGTPYDTPWHESFAGVSMEGGPWTWDIVDGDPYIQIVAEGTYPYARPQDEDGGMVTFMPEESNDEAILYSPNISLVGAERPEFSFWYYNNPSSYDQISVLIRLDDDPSTQKEISWVRMSSASDPEGWTPVKVSLEQYVGHRVQLLFRFVTSSGEYIHIDNIGITALRSDLPYITDLQGTFDNGAARLTWSEPADDGQGLGLVGYNVYRDGQLLTTDEPIVENEFVDEYGINDVEHTYQVTVVYDEGETVYSNAVVVNAQTGISSVVADGKNADIYDVRGVRLNSVPARGAYILSNKKYVK